MHNLCSVKLADAEGRIWHVIDTLGHQVGACSSREEAMRIAAFVNRTSNGEDAHSAVPSTPVVDVREDANRLAGNHPQMFEWYSSCQGLSAWALLRSCYSRLPRLLRRRG